MNNYTYQTFQYDAQERQEKARRQQRAEELKPNSNTDDNCDSRKRRR